MIRGSRSRSRLQRMFVMATALSALAALVLVATPVVADPTPFTAENFNPDTSGTGGPPQNATDDTETSVMSDLNDGGNSTFHATTVTTINATLVQYYFCPTAFPDNQVDPGTDAVGEDPTQAVNGCQAASAADTTGITPSGVDVGEAYGAEIDIPPSLDGQTRDFVAWVCAGSTTTAADCDAEVEPSVQLDDASQGGTTSSGEITSPVHPSSPSNQGFTAEARTSPDVTAVTFCLAMLDGTAPAPFAPADETGDPTQCVTDPDFDGTAGTPSIKTDTSPNTTQATHKTWSVAFSDAETPNNTEMALVLFEGTSTDGEGPAVPSPPAESGIGLCKDPGAGTPGATDCQLDSHYVVTTPVAPATAEIAFPDEGDESSLPNDCTDSTATSSAEDEPEQYTRVQGCILDQSGNNVTDTEHWAFQISPVDPAGTTDDETGFECFTPGPGKTCSDTDFPEASPGSGEHTVSVAPGVAWPNYECTDRDPSPDVPPGSGCPSGDVGADGTQKDFNGDFFYESADGEPAGTGEGSADIADEVVEFHTGGTYTITFCLDSNNDAGTSPTPCAGETVSATGSKFVRATVDHVHVKRQGTTDAQCHTGEVFTSEPEGGTVSLQGCALALIDTAESPAPGAHVAWVLNPAATPDAPGTIQSSQTVTDSNGQATAQVTAPDGSAGKSTTVRFCLDEHPESTTAAPNGNGVCDSQEPASGAEAKTHADFRIDWTEGGGGPDPDPDGRTVIRGVDICNKNRPTANGPELLIGDNGPNKICGFGGRDTLRGLNGKDDLRGGKGKDVMSGARGQDNARGGKGADSMRGGKHADTLKGGPGRDTARGGPDNDLCRAEIERGCEQ